MPVVGLLAPRAAGDAQHLLGAFHQGLQDTGFVERQNVAIEYRWAENQNDRLPALAADLVCRRVIVTAAPGSSRLSFTQRARPTRRPKANLAIPLSLSHSRCALSLPKGAGSLDLGAGRSYDCGHFTRGTGAGDTKAFNDILIFFGARSFCRPHQSWQAQFDANVLTHSPAQ
jgi:hypothetical protein